MAGTSLRSAISLDSRRAPARPLVRDAASLSAVRPSGTVQLWAALGTALIALALNNWVRWVLSADFVQPDPGPDPYPYLWVLRLTECVSSAMFVILLCATVILPLLRRGTLTLDGKLFIGGFFASTLDVMYGMYNPTWAMNAHAYSMGTWASFFPGFSSPAMEKNAWGLFWCLPAYIWLGVGAAILGCAILDGLRRRFPRMSTVSLYLLLQLIYMLAFTLLATLWNRTQVYTYMSAPPGLTLWYGKTWQLPLYEPLCIAAYCLGYTWLRDSRDANGYCAVDRDLAKRHYSPAARTLLSLLAVCGFAGFTTIAAYQIPDDWFAMKGESEPALPSYLRPGMWCGQPGEPLCAGQYLIQQREAYYRQQSAAAPRPR